MFDINKKIKSILNNGTSSKAITLKKPFAMGSAKSSSHFFITMNKKEKHGMNLAKGGVFFPFISPTVKSPTGKVIKGNMPGMNRVMNNMLGDKDKDGVVNIMDCKVNNKKYHGGELYWKELEKKGIKVKGTPKRKKQIRKTFEKYPELVELSQQKRKDVSFSIISGGQAPDNVPVSVYMMPQERNKGWKEAIVFSDQYFIDKNKPFVKALKHELQHRQDAWNLSSEQLHEEDIKRDKVMKKFEKKKDTELHRKQFNEEYSKLDSEQRANSFENTISERNIKPSQTSVDNASIAMQNRWEKMSEKQRDIERQNHLDSDGDRVPDKYDCEPNNVMRQ